MIYSQLFSRRMSGLVVRWAHTAAMGIKTEPNFKGHQTLKKFTSDCCGLALSMVFLVKSELGKKVGRSLSTKSLCPCIVLSLKCTAKAPLIIKDWFKRPFHNLSKQWAWLMLHIISSCHLLLLRVFTVPLTPPQYQPESAAEQLLLRGWWHNCNPEPSNCSLLIDCKSTTLLSVRLWARTTSSQGFGSSLCRFPKLQAPLHHKVKLTSGKIQNFIILSAFLYHGSYFSPTEIMKVGSVNKRRIKKIVSTPSLTSISKAIILHLLMSNSVHSMMKTSMFFPLVLEENLMECVMFCFVLLFFELLVLPCAPSQHDEYCSFPSNNWTVRTRGCLWSLILTFTKLLPGQQKQALPQLQALFG